MQFNANIRISEQKHETCFNVFTASMSIFEIFFSTIRISEQKHETCFNVFTVSMSILEVYLTYTNKRAKTHIVRSTGKRSESNL